MLLIVGLGNPGEKYKETRHNAGFLAADHLQQAREFPQYIKDEKNKLQHSKGIMFQKEIMLMKPQTFMNLSGSPIKYIMNSLKINSHKILILHDEIDYQIGIIKFKEKGGAAGHNGIKNIIETIATNEFSRIRIGIGKPIEKKQIISYVLEPFKTEEYKILKDSFNEVEKKVKERIQKTNL